tara:strand:- start:509 stop:1453 length:945 start_codon:yes stop_codon:yes gene_type:complete
MAKGLQAKVTAHNANSKHKVTTSMLTSVYRRGIGAYKTNPGSVRPNVSSPEQWAMARVNSFLRIVSGSKSPKHDKDLLPASHASSSKKSDEEVTKAEYQGEKVTLNKPRRIQGGNKKFEVFVESGGKVKRVSFGDPNMEIRRDDPKARANFRARHNCDSKKDKTTAGYWSCRMWEGGTSVSQLTKHNIEGQILKADDEQRLVYGWASVVTEKGEPVVDRQGDVIEPETLVKAVNSFMENIRVGKEMHKGDQIGAVIHSMPITKEIGESLGIQSDREGWVVAFKVYDDDVWARVKSGELSAFSIGGRAVKESYDA